MSDWFAIAIVALLPVGAVLTVLQHNPYHALVARGIFGVIAALVYATLGAADVALTEILVGTLLTIVLYAIAVRSSLVLRVGWVSSSPEGDDSAAAGTMPVELMRDCSEGHHLRMELVAFQNMEKLLDALNEGSISAAWGQGPTPGTGFSTGSDHWLVFDSTDRLQASFRAALKNHPVAVQRLSEWKREP